MPSLPRLHAFEFNDSSWAPESLRETIVESLSRALRWGRMLRNLVVPFQEFVARSGATEVLDLCAGAAGPARILVEEIVRTGGTPPHIVLTDLYPHLEEWEEVRAALPDSISFVAEPVDATRIPADIARGRVRTIINAFHHFPPELARAILADGVAGSEGVFISEHFARNPLQFASTGPAGLVALLANPLLSPRSRGQKALITWVTPIALACGIWDGLVSTMRVYTEEELRAMVAPLGDRFEWHYRRYTYWPLGEGYCFFSVPRGA